MNLSPKAIVAGAGALGCASALALARAGWAVEVRDPAPPLDSASGVAAGMLAPTFEAITDPMAAPHLDLMRAGLDLWPDFAAAAGIDLDRRGALAVGDEARLAGLAARAAQLGLPLQRLTRGEAQALAPCLGVTAGGLLAKGDWRIDAAMALAALRASARALGVDFVARPVRGDEPADLLVVATGAALGLADAVPELRRLSPIKGHILRVPGLAYDGAVVRAEGAYLVPSRRGLVVGATMEHGVRDPAVDPQLVQALVAAGQAAFPALAGARVEAETGVRAATADGLPMVGPGSRPGVILAAGARRNGWLLAPLVAQLVAAYAAGRDAGAWAALLDPRRFEGG